MATPGENRDRGLTTQEQGSPSMDEDITESKNLESEHQNRHNGFDDFDDVSVDAAWTESTDVPRRRLGFIQVSALMINQMIGTGIFSTPATVLLLTGSKPISLALWAVGGIYSFLSALLYLEYGNALPYNGGPLIWLDETFHKPAMLAATIFSWYWVLLATSGNSMQAAAYIVSLLSPDKAYNHLDQGLVKFLAVVVQTVICLLLYFMRRVSFMVNSLFAAFKVVLLLVLFIAGMVTTSKADSGTHDFGQTHSGSSGVNSVAAMIWVIFAYQGWEHTNYIAGEIREPKVVLKRAVLFSIGIVTLLYMMVTTAYFTALTYVQIKEPVGHWSIGIMFAEKTLNGMTGMKVAIMLSAFSNAIAYTYTSAKVKQAIAWQRIIPFYKFFGRQDRQFDSPGGALVLHWIVTVPQLASHNYRGPARSFSSGLFTYGYQLEMLFLAVGLLRLGSRMRMLSEDWRPTYLRSKLLLWSFASVLVGFNATILVVTALPETQGNVPCFYWPVTIVAIVIAAIIHWCMLRALWTKWRGGPMTLGQRIGFEVKVHSQDDEEAIPDSLNHLMREAIADGSRRRVEYMATGTTAVIVQRLRAGCTMVTKYLE